MVRDRSVIRARAGGLRQPGRRVRRDSRLNPSRLELVWRSGIRVPGPRPLLADPAYDRTVLLGVHAIPDTARPPADRAQRKHAVAVLVLCIGHPGILCRGAAGAAGEPFHHHRFLAFLGGAFVGGGFPGAVHHCHGGLHLRPAGSGGGTRGPDRNLPRHRALFGRRRDRHHASSLLFRDPGRTHGAGSIFLGRRGDSADLPDRGGLELPAARGAATSQVSYAVPTLLGGDVSGLSRVLELSGSRRFWIFDQPSRGVLLRDWNRTDHQPRTRGHDGRLRDAGGWLSVILHTLPDSGRAMVGPGGESQLLVAQHRPGMDGFRHLVSTGTVAVVRIGESWLFRSAQPQIPDQRRKRVPRMVAAAGRCRVHRWRSAAAVIYMLDGDPPHGPAHHERNARHGAFRRSERALNADVLRSGSLVSHRLRNAAAGDRGWSRVDGTAFSAAG